MTIDGTQTMYSLKDIENGWEVAKPEGASNKSLDNWKRSPDVIELTNLREIHVASVNGGGTWGCKDAVIEYASHCSIPFRAAVRKTFLLASQGKGTEATIVASSVAITPEMIAKEKEVRKEFIGHIMYLYPKQKWMKMNYNIKNFTDLANKVATGFTSKSLTGGGESLLSYVQKKDHSPSLGAVVATLEMLNAMFREARKNEAYRELLDYQLAKSLLAI